MPRTLPTAFGDDPDAPVFEMPILVTDEHVDAPGYHVNNVVYVRWVQDVATAHWRAVTPNADEARLVWYVLRHEIDYLKECFVGDRLVARTHVGRCAGARFERLVEIVRDDGTAVARARSVWAAVDRTTGRPKRITAEMQEPYRRKPVAG